MGFWDPWHLWNTTSLSACTLVLYQGKVTEHWRALLSQCITLKRNWGVCGGGEENHRKWGLSGRRGWFFSFLSESKCKSITINYCTATWWGVSDGAENKDNHKLYSVSSKLLLMVTVFTIEKMYLKCDVGIWDHHIVFFQNAAVLPKPNHCLRASFWSLSFLHTGRANPQKYQEQPQICTRFPKGKPWPRSRDTGDSALYQEMLEHHSSLVKRDAAVTH